MGNDRTLALSVNGANIQGGVLLRRHTQTGKRFRAQGGVDLTAVKIGIRLECSGGEFVGSNRKPALSINGANITGAVVLSNGFKAQGGVLLRGATIGGDLDCDGGEFVGNEKNPALNADRANIQSTVFLRNGFKAQAGVVLRSATIKGDLDCGGGEFVGDAKNSALSAERAEIQGAVFLRNGFKARGRVVLGHVDIGGSLHCGGGEFVGDEENPALDAERANIQGAVLLYNGFKARGAVVLLNATIKGDLNCGGGEFVGKGDHYALDADGANIEGSALFRQKTKVVGKVRFTYASIARSFQWRDLESPESAILNLQFTRVGTLFNSANSWPTEGNLHVDGLLYDQIDGRADRVGKQTFRTSEVQLGWLHRQPADKFLSQPYEHLGGVLRNWGLDEDAREVMIAKNKDQAKHLHWRPSWLWYGLIGKLIGYGYRPWRAFIISLIIIGIGSMLFGAGYQSKVLTSVDEKAYVDKDRMHRLSEFYPRFNAPVYSVETFVPLLKLGMSQAWAPNAKRHQGSLTLGHVTLPLTGRFLRYYLWFHIIAGWVLTALWVGALTGLAKT